MNTILNITYTTMTKKDEQCEAGTEEEKGYEVLNEDDDTEYRLYYDDEAWEEIDHDEELRRKEEAAERWEIEMKELNSCHNSN